MPFGRLPRGHPMGGLGIHVYVDIRRSLSRNQVTIFDLNDHDLRPSIWHVIQ